MNATTKDERRRRTDIETESATIVIPESVGRDVKIMIVRRLTKYSDDTFMTDGEEASLSPNDDIVTRDATLITVVNCETDVIQSAKDLISSAATPTHQS